MTTLRRIEGSKKLTAKLPYERDFQKIVHLKIFQWMPNMWLSAWDLVNSWKRQSTTTTVLSKTWPDDVQEWEWILYLINHQEFSPLSIFLFFFCSFICHAESKRIKTEKELMAQNRKWRGSLNRNHWANELGLPRLQLTQPEMQKLLVAEKPFKLRDKNCVHVYEASRA